MKITNKSIECLKLLIEVAIQERNFLYESWVHILKAVSLLENMSAVLSKKHQEFQKASQNPNQPALGFLAKKPELTSDVKAMEKTVEAVRIFPSHFSYFLQINFGMIDRIFAESGSLNSACIESFVRALCQVSVEELEVLGPDNHPRMFSLQKLVDIAHFNMDRIRVVWARIWGIFAEHFTKVFFPAIFFSNEILFYL